MAIKVELSQEVIAFVSRRAPEQRRVLRAALRAMSEERGDIRALEGCTNITGCGSEAAV